MADGMNHVRAIRLAEILQEFRVLQHYISQIQIPPSNGRSPGKGFTLLQQCYREGQEVLNAPAPSSPKSPNGDVEKEKSQLQYVILDAASRRFQAQEIYLKVTAALRWINSYNALTNPPRAAAVRAIDEELDKELTNITDENVHEQLQTNDQQQGKWVDEDPDLGMIKSHLEDSR